MNDSGDARLDGSRCFVCGPQNEQGLRIPFRLEGELCRAEFTPGPQYCGYDEQLHGGILFSVLDDVMANWLFLKGLRAHTARMAIRYRQPVAIGTRLALTGRLDKRKGRVALMRALAQRVADGAIVAEAEGRFMIVAD